MSAQEYRAPNPMTGEQEKEPKARSKTFASVLFNGSQSDLLPVAADPVTSLLLLLVVGFPALLFVSAFSAQGYGKNNYTRSVAHEHMAWYTGCAGMFVVMVLYTLDFTHWAAKWLLNIKKLAVLAIGCLFVATVLFSAGDYPYGPACLFVVGLPIWLLKVKWIVMPKKDFRTYIGLMPLPMGLCALITFGYWVVWLFNSPEGDASESHEWNETTRFHYSRDVACDLAELPEDYDASAEGPWDYYPNCIDAFMLWVSPLVASFVLGFFAIVAYALDPRSEHHAPKMFGWMLLLVLFMMWCAASLSGVGDVSGALGALVFSCMIAIGCLVVGMFGSAEIAHQAHDNPHMLAMKAKWAPYADWFRGLAVITFTPMFVLYLGVSFVNQLVRRIPCIGCTKTLTAEDRGLWLTQVTSKQLQLVLGWPRTSILTKAVWIGFAYMVLNVVVAQFTILFLSWLIEAVASLHWLVTSCILCGVGMFLFLLPPVPGVPIYLTGGIVLVSSIRDQLGSLALGIVITFFVSLFIKLLACTAQQKAIGVPCGKELWVRQLVGVNTVMTRTMKLILSDEGITLGKVAILVGGPDWPTSVLCGILDLKWAPVMIGTLPVGFLIFPTILSGTFMFLKDENDWAGTAATISAAMVMMVQSGSLVMAGFFLEKTANSRRDEILAMPIDQEVADADARSAERAELYKEVTKWELLGGFTRMCLYVACGLMMASCYMVQLFSCFVPYELTYKISQNLPGGKWYNLLTTQGWVSMLMFGASFLVLYAFGSFASGWVAKAEKDADRPAKVELAVTSDVAAIVPGEDGRRTGREIKV